MLFSSTYTSLSGSLVFASIAVYMLYLDGFQSGSQSFSDALTALAYLSGFTQSVAGLAQAFALVGPTLGIFQRISNGLQKLKDVFNTYEQFDARYACAVYALPV